MQFTEAQTRAIETDSRQVLCLAGAGGGKTAVLTQRIARLLDGGVSPESIACFTFTRRASDSMKTRLADILVGDGWTPEEAAEALWHMLIGTFHSIALRILRAWGDRLGYAANLTIASQDDADLLLKVVARDHGYYDGAKWLQGMSWSTLAGYREAQYTGAEYQFTGKTADKCRAACPSLLAEYWQRLKAMNVLDYGLLLQEVQRLFRECPDVLAKYNAQIAHVLIDECQDLDRTQYNLWEYLVPPATLFAVGDFRQSIYAFRGASPEVLRDKMSSGAMSPEIIDLRENFRSGRLIVEASNRLISHNGDELAQPMLAVPDNGDGQVLAEFCPLEQLPAIIAKWHGGFGGFAWQDMAVIARKHRTLIGLEQPLRDAGIPYQRVGAAFDICQTPEFMEVHAYLRLQQNPRDDLAFLRLFGGKMPPTQYADIRASAAELGHPHLTTAVGMAQVQWIQPESEDLIDVLHCKAVPVFIAQWWLNHCGDMTLEEALSWFGALQMERGEDYAERDAVTLITAHASKGLEWPFVLIANMNEGDMPTTRKDSDIEEETRVCYVSMTRARQLLVLHSQPEDPERHVKPPSRFLGESLGEVHERIGTEHQRE